LSILSSDKQVMLSGFLGRLPEHVASRLAKAVEVDRLIGGTLPHEAILRALRPQLRMTPQLKRTETPLRVFCRPFEDILVDAHRDTKQKGRIARTSVEPVWRWLGDELMPERHIVLVEALRDALVGELRDEIHAKAVALWSETGFALRSALADPSARRAAIDTLGGMAAVEDAAEMALLLTGAEDIVEVQKRLPVPVAGLTDDDISFLRDEFDRLNVRDPDLAPYIALVVMGRLERPWEALRLAAVLSRKATDTLMAGTDLGTVGELLFSDLDFHARKIQTARPYDFDPDVILASLAAFAELSTGMVKELSIRRDGKWGQRLARDRTNVAETIGTLLAKAPKEILSALAQPKSAGFGRGKRLDISRAPDPERVARAMRYANLSAHSRPFAVAAAFNAKLAEVLEEVTIELRSYSEDLLREVRAASPEGRANAEAHFTVMLELSKLILGDEEADFLRRRARVAVGA
jgi:hypothetical protein